MNIAKTQFLSEKQTDRLTRILEVTKQKLEEIGAEKLTMRKIAEASGVSPTTLYNRFDTKDNLISIALVDHFEERIASELNQPKFHRKPPLEQLKHMLELMALNSIDYPRFTEVLTTLHFKASNDSQMTQALAQRIGQVLLNIIHQLLEDELLADWITPELIAEEMTDKLFCVHARASQESFLPEMLVDYSVTGCLLILRAVATPDFHADIDALLKSSVAAVIDYEQGNQ